LSTNCIFRSDPVQFFDYTASPLHQQLIASAPNPKYQLFLDAVGMSSPLLYTHSEAYLAPNGTYVAVGMKPDGVPSFFSLVWNMFLRPTWLGGTKRTLKYAFKFLLRYFLTPTYAGAFDSAA
jgi:hypothetical protein